jgi:hypothetical protein
MIVVMAENPEPADLTETERALLGRPDLLALIDESFEHPERWVGRGWRPSHGQREPESRSNPL